MPVEEESKDQEKELTGKLGKEETHEDKTEDKAMIKELDPPGTGPAKEMPPPPPLPKSVSFISETRSEIPAEDAAEAAEHDDSRAEGSKRGIDELGEAPAEIGEGADGYDDYMDDEFYVDPASDAESGAGDAKDVDKKVCPVVDTKPNKPGGKGEGKGKKKKAATAQKVQCTGCWKWFKKECMPPGSTKCWEDKRALNNLFNLAKRLGKSDWYD